MGAPKDILRQVVNQDKQTQYIVIQEVKKALRLNGFKKEKSDKEGIEYFSKMGCLMEVTDNDKLEDIFNRLINIAKTQKLWEIQRALGIGNQK